MMILTALLALLAFYTLVLLLVARFQRHLMYHPFREVRPAADYGLAGVEELTLVSADGTKLQAWFAAAKPGMPLMVYFHGNGGNLGRRAEKFRHFMQAGFGVLAMGYRGFGQSEGAPHEAGIYADARAALDYAASRGYPAEGLVVYGESLGSGVAVQMATERRFGLMVLEAPYTSVAKRSAEIFFWLPTRRLVRDKYNSLAKIKQMRQPLLIFHNEIDKVIPVRHGRALFAAAPEPKEAHWLNGPAHCIFDWEFVTARILKAATDYGLVRV